MLTVVLLIFAGMLSAVMDTVSNKYTFDRSYLKGIADWWFDSSISHLNKKKAYEFLKTKLTFFPDGLVKFIAFDIFVIVSDCWHLCKYINLLCVFYALLTFDKDIIYYINPALLTFFLVTVYQSGFWTTYTFVLPKE